MSRGLCLLICFASHAAAQTVTGSVFNAATGTPAAGIKVELLRSTTPFYETTTDGGGRFRFDDVRAGDYSVRYQSPDYFLTAGPTDYKPFPVTADNPVVLEMRLIPYSRISGRLLDLRGKPVPKAQIELTGLGMVSGNRTYQRSSVGGGGGGELNARLPSMALRATTDAEGKFEVRLMPSAYLLSVLPPPGLEPPDAEPKGLKLAWVRTWYPGVAEQDDAAKIVVLAGGEVSGIEFRLLAVPAHSVRGIVLNPDGSPAPKTRVTVQQQFPGRSADTNPDGSFAFDAVTEGEWQFNAQMTRAGVELRGIEWIEVPKHDLENVIVRLARPLTLRGKLVVEGDKGIPLPRASPMVLAPKGGRNSREMDLVPGMGSLPFTPDANGNINVELYPGVYRLSSMLQHPPPPYYLDAVLAGAVNLITQEAELSSDGIGITVVYKTDGGSVLGRAENCAGGGVIVVPRDPPLRDGFSRSAPCDSSGHYEIQAVRPGDYYVMALAGNGPAIKPDDAVLAQAVKVTVRAGEVSSADVKTVTRPVY